MRKSTVRTRTTIHNHQEVLEIFSSDEEEMSGGQGGAEIEMGDSESIEFDHPSPIPTNWPHSDIVSRVVEEHVKVTTHFTAERVEYISEIPAIWPIFKVPTAVVLDLRDPKFHVVVNGKALSPDALIKNKVSLQPVRNIYELVFTVVLLGSGLMERWLRFC